MATTPTIPCWIGSLWRRFSQMRWRWPQCQTLALSLSLSLASVYEMTYAHRHHFFMAVTAVHSHASSVSYFPAFPLSHHFHLCGHVSLFHKLKYPFSTNCNITDCFCALLKKLHKLVRYVLKHGSWFELVLSWSWAGLSWLWASPEQELVEPV